ncbi:hypothetical protein Hdeb2414_s0010g00329261 [Helianthus debilis subsp. tardiflorus]
MGENRLAWPLGFAHPYLAYMMFIPCSLAGMLFPRVCWNFSLSLSKWLHSQIIKREICRGSSILGCIWLICVHQYGLFLFSIKWRFLELVISCFYGSSMDFI